MFISYFWRVAWTDKNVRWARIGILFLTGLLSPFLMHRLDDLATPRGCLHDSLMGVLGTSVYRFPFCSMYNSTAYETFLPPDTHFSWVRKSHWVVRTTGHLCDLLIEQAGRHEHWSYSLVGCPVSQLAVTIMAPGKQFSIWRTKRLVILQHFSIQMWGRGALNVLFSYPLWPAGCGVHCRSSGWPPSSHSRSPPSWAR